LRKLLFILVLPLLLSACAVSPPYEAPSPPPSPAEIPWEGKASPLPDEPPPIPFPAANGLSDEDVRIIYLPPMTAAAAYATGNDCEGKALDMIKQFVNESGLLEIKPDARSFGFDCSRGETAIGEASHGYEAWVSVPDDMELPEPLIKRTFSGGLYAAHELRDWDFTYWSLLGDWVNASDTYDNDWGSPRWASDESDFGQGFEETVDFFHYIQKGGHIEDFQLDLLFPIREKAK